MHQPVVVKVHYPLTVAQEDTIQTPGRGQKDLRTLERVDGCMNGESHSRGPNQETSRERMAGLQHNLVSPRRDSSCRPCLRFHSSGTLVTVTPGRSSTTVHRGGSDPPPADLHNL